MNNVEVQVKNDMTVGLYSVCDRVAGFNNVMTVKNDQTAIRTFKNAVLHKDSIFQENPEDYCLVKVGEMSITTGEITPCYEELCEAWDTIKQARKGTEEPLKS